MMKKVKIIRSTTASGKRVEAGKSYTLSPRDAEILVGMGKAEYIKAKAGKSTKKDGPSMVVPDAAAGGPDLGAGA